MTDLFTVIKNDKERIENEKAELQERKIVEGAKTFLNLKAKHQDYFLSSLNEFFGIKVKCEFIALNNYSYNPSDYYQKIDMRPQFAIVQILATNDYSSFRLKINKYQDVYDISLLKTTGVSYIISSPGELYSYIAKK